MFLICLVCVVLFVVRCVWFVVCWFLLLACCLLFVELLFDVC